MLARAFRNGDERWKCDRSASNARGDRRSLFASLGHASLLLTRYRLMKLKTV
jgi:hypothetical protein